MKNIWTWLRNLFTINKNKITVEIKNVRFGIVKKR